MPRSAAAAKTDNNITDLWRQPSVCERRAMLGMAVQCFGAWRQRCPSNFFQDYRFSKGQLRGMHREAGRALKRMCQVSAWAFCKQQWSRHSPYCKMTWLRCGCCIHLAPRDWQRQGANDTLPHPEALVRQLLAVAAEGLPIFPWR